MPWVSPRRRRPHRCHPPHRERRWLHGLVCVGDEWWCFWCKTSHVVSGTEQIGVGRTDKRLYWRKINDD